MNTSVPLSASSVTAEDYIQPYLENPSYWQYKGEPVLLIGGSIEDNLYQIDEITSHLDLLASVGGNYVRCTMSARDEGNVQPFALNSATGRYDLDSLNPEYWERFQRFLELTLERDIILQIEVWDRFDFARDPWQGNAFNPKLNTNYTVEESGLKEEINSHPGARESAFFRSVPALENNELLLKYQEKFVTEMLRHSLNYPNVLYCMDNETNESPEWGAYWARFIRAKAEEKGVPVQTTEMWDDKDLNHAQHRNTFDHPELYTFIDISQNNHKNPYDHWLNMQEMRERVLKSGHVRPMNSVKIYGANTGRYGSNRDAQERLWRNIFGGQASSRFHRPDSGLGLNQIAQAHIRSLRLVTGKINVYESAPARELILGSSYNESYCMANPGKTYAVFFPDGGNVVLRDRENLVGKKVCIEWMEVLKSGWLRKEYTVVENGDIPLDTPHYEGYYAVVITVLDD